MRTRSLIVVGLFLAACGSDGGSGGEGGSSNAGSGGSAGKNASGAGGSGGEAGSSSMGGTAGTSGGGASGSASTGGSAGSGPCAPTDHPSVGDCTLSDDVAVFVSRAGTDIQGTGTQAKPFASITRGVQEAASTGKRLYVCADAGDYNESLTLGASANGVEIYGGFRCSDWTWDASYRARVIGKGKPAARVEGAEGLRLDHLDLRGTTIPAAGESAIGLWVQDSKAVVVVDTLVHAAKGEDGASGVDGVSGDDGTPAGPEQDGSEYDSSTLSGPGGSWPGPSACGSRGGDGAAANTTATVSGEHGQPITNVTPEMVDNRGLTGEGGPGSPGNAGAHGLEGGSGVIASSGYVAGDGNDGNDGYPGQGGGGGAGRKLIAGIPLKGGGAGGMGGCGGHAGTKGLGGGASIALVSWDSELTLTRVQLETAGGGAGGRGGNGGAGGLGAEGGESTVYGLQLTNAHGGKGGDGGKAGAGSGGSGGISLGLAIHGSVPVQSEVVISPGSGGTPGSGGYSLETTDKAPDGRTGESLERLVL